MSESTYIEALRRAKADLTKAIMARDQLNLEIVRLQQLVRALTYQAVKKDEMTKTDAEAPAEVIGFTEAVLTIVRASEEALTARNIRDRLVELGYELGRYANPLGFVHSVLGRLEEQGKIRQSQPGVYVFNNAFFQALLRAGIDSVPPSPGDIPELSVQSPPAKPELTSRQQQLINLVAKGLTNKEIASHLNLSEFTVKNHLKRILKYADEGRRSEALGKNRTA